MGTIWLVVKILKVEITKVEIPKGEIPRIEIPDDHSPPITWIIDSRCTTNITPRHDVFTTYTALPAGEMQLCTANGENIDPLGYRSIQFGHMIVENVYPIPTLQSRFFSVSHLGRQELYTTFGGNKVTIRASRTGNIVATGQQIGKYYELVDGTANENDYSDVVYTTQSNTLTLWYHRLAHLHQVAVIPLARSGNIGIQATLSQNTYE